ncbi:MAG: prepilin-type N-terminal cleavage/methylation domain-containing protein [Actinobacteria bacterium]|uniref:Unannotated protein n=1 Tax=freshwater metagenome TaxID=449393 RepID=A0A6J6KV64_9ZZZZ|nr:prepilin-type N-terminal cleavage/methylation domain-containing protein [Actinomycetota bacterium]MSW04667.1 prepilin-type N-terminal cleavage/methylation domain-containing protein [Actinomycetota bacterium]MSX32224.1 prepilin-type N-terminal cleavage/methylation domain-containing protein [Actinomycetota bacterium]MSX81653.1 prepilin-type N-terminal cleavage/methylation domain-containing protein [Actinomycetota bacterium]MSY06118.1 prepilin-type N-terminal cleavage/methylation domain-contain
MTDQRSNTQLSERRLGAPRRGDNRENGFSLVELMVVVMILGVLLAVALPTFLGARRPASDRRAETILHTALLAARSSVDTQEGYANLSTAKLLGAEGSIRFIDGGTDALATRNEASVNFGNYGGYDFFVAVTRSASGTCFTILDRADAPTGFRTDASPNCRANAVDLNGVWSESW